MAVVLSAAEVSVLEKEIRSDAAAVPQDPKDIFLRRMADGTGRDRGAPQNCQESYCEGRSDDRRGDWRRRPESLLYPIEKFWRGNCLSRT